jgi:hypothetical protein
MQLNELLNCCRQEGARIPPADKDGGNSLFGIEYNRNTVSMFNYQGPAKVPTTLLPYGLVDFAWSRAVYHRRFTVSQHGGLCGPRSLFEARKMSLECESVPFSSYSLQRRPLTLVFSFKYPHTVLSDSEKGLCDDTFFKPFS